MKLLKKLTLWLLAWSSIAVCGEPAPESWFIPMPKTLKRTKAVSFKGSEYRLIDHAGVAPEKLAEFRRFLKEKMNWVSGETGNIRIETGYLEKPHPNPEYYTLDIRENHIRIAASGESGIMRGLSRIRAVLSTPLTEIRQDGTAILPGLSIKDYPDIKIRGFMIGNFIGPRSSRDDVHEYVKLMIDQAAALQYNHLFFLVGGRLRSEKHPEINRPDYLFSRKELSEFVRMAESRGMTACPMINSIGHVSSAPRISPVYHTDLKTGVRKEIGMNVCAPEFWKIYSEYVDELRVIFRNPPYFSIGTDEFDRNLKEIEKACGKPCSEFYPEFVNRVNRFLKPHGIQTMIYHDMLGPGGRHKWPEETLGGPRDAMEMLKKFDKDVNVVYWNYFHSNTYPFLQDLIEAGFEKLWCAVWFGAEPVKALCRRAYAGNMAVLATHWAGSPTANVFVHGSEYSWNIAEESPKNIYDFEDLNEFFFYGRNSKLPVGKAEFVKLTGGMAPPEDFRQAVEKRFSGDYAIAYGVPVKFSGMRVLAPVNWKLPEITKPWNFAEIEADGGLRNLWMYSDSSVAARSLGQNVSRNRKRERGSFIIYDSSFGKSTGTDRRGAEFSTDSKGKILSLSGNSRNRTGDETGNMNIPENGFVFSMYGAQPCFYTYRGYGFFPMLREGDVLHLRRRMKSAPKVPPVVGKLNPALGNIVVFLTVMRPTGSLLGKIRLNFADDSSRILTLYSDIFYTALFKRGFVDYDRWIAWSMVRYGLKPVVALEWKAETIPAALKSVTVSVEPEGVAAGLTVLGITQYGNDQL